METSKKKLIKTETIVAATIEKVWNFWTNPEHIIQWNNASDDWHTPKAENDLSINGKFIYHMEAKDNSAAFNFEGTYKKIKNNEKIEYEIADGRNVTIDFIEEGEKIKITQTFEAEDNNTLELQKTGWQSIMDNFKKYTENN